MEITIAIKTLEPNRKRWEHNPETLVYFSFALSFFFFPFSLPLSPIFSNQGFQLAQILVPKTSPVKAGEFVSRALLLQGSIPPT